MYEKNPLSPHLQIYKWQISSLLSITHRIVGVVNIEFAKPYSLKKVVQILKKAPGCKVIDTRKDGGYSTPYEAEGSYLTYISRIRKDNSNKKAINLWVVSDNLLKGAALNTVQIAEVLVKKYIR